jgi:hypothetical protein
VRAGAVSRRPSRAAPIGSLDAYRMLGLDGPLSVAPKEMAPGLSHGVLEADLPDVDVRE